MKVAFLGDGLQYRRTGLGNYAYHLLWSLAELQGLSLTVFFNYLRRPPVNPSTIGLPAAPQVRYRTIRAPATLLGRLLCEGGLPAELVYGRQDVVHSPDAAGPIRSAAHRVLTIHDLIPYVLPREYPDRYAHVAGSKVAQTYFRQVPVSIARSDRIIAVSRSTAQDLQEYFRVPSERIEVIPYGIDARFVPHPVQDARPVLARYDIDDRPFVLLVGRVEYRKNHALAVQAISLLKQRGRLRDHRVVLVGGPGGGLDGERAREDIERVGLADLRQVGYVHPEDMPFFYAAADALLFPTRYEGFGFPALEAMACGTPVVTSCRSSLPEVVADAALQVDPEDAEALADATDRVIDDSQLRARLIDKGRRQAAKFTWEAAARRTADVYRAVT